MIHFLGIRRRDILFEAKELQNDVLLIKNGTAGDLLEKLSKRLIRECQLQQSFFDKYSSKIVVHEIMHSRIEYLFVILRKLLSEKKILESDVAQIIVHVMHIFSIVHSVLVYCDARIFGFQASNFHPTVDSDNCNNLFCLPYIQTWDKQLFGNIYADLSRESRSGTNWYAMCRSAAVVVLGELLKLKPHAKDALNISMATACLAVHSRLWELQYLALSFIASSLKHEQCFTQSETVSEESFKKRITLLSPSKEQIKPGENGNYRSSSSKKLVKKPPTSTSAHYVHDKHISFSKQLKDSEELYRMGMLRSICWFLIHDHFMVRHLAAETLDLFIKVSSYTSYSSAKDHANHSNEGNLWSCCAEQGVIPLLESIRIGFPYMHKSFLYVRRPKNGKLVSEGRFPEYNIRHVATIFLQSVTSSLEGASGSRQRLTAALTHSGNQKLRSNIMLGLLFIGGRSANVGRLLFEKDGAHHVRVMDSNIAPISREKCFLTHMLHSISQNQDSAEMKRTIEYLLYLIRLTQTVQPVHSYANRWEERMISFHSEKGLVAPPRVPNCDDSIFSTNWMIEDNNEALRVALERINPVIIVSNGIIGNGPRASYPQQKGRATLHNGANIVKMVCPPLCIIRKHSSRLAKDIEDFHRLQLREALNILTHRSGDFQLSDGSTDLFGWEKEVKHLLNSNGVLDESIYYSIQGSYSLWQEIFTHMSDEYLMKRSLGKMSVSDLLDAYAVAWKYEMPGLLTKYCEMLIRNIATVNLFQIMQVAIIDRPHTDRDIGVQHINVNLCLACLEYVNVEWHKLRWSLSTPQLELLIDAMANIFVVLMK